MAQDTQAIREAQRNAVSNRGDTPPTSPKAYLMARSFAARAAQARKERDNADS